MQSIKYFYWYLCFATSFIVNNGILCLMKYSIWGYNLHTFLPAICACLLFLESSASKTFLFSFWHGAIIFCRIAIAIWKHSHFTLGPIFGWAELKGQKLTISNFKSNDSPWQISLQTIWNHLKKLPNANIKGTFLSTKLTKITKIAHFSLFYLVTGLTKWLLQNLSASFCKKCILPHFWEDFCELKNIVRASDFLCNFLKV